MITVARRLIRQLRNDRRSLGMMFAAPLVILSLLYFLMGAPNVQLRIALVGSVPPALDTALAEVGTVEVAPNDLNIDQVLDEGTYDAVVSANDKGVEVHLLQDNPDYEGKLRAAFQSAQPQPQGRISPTPPTPSASFTYLYGQGLDTLFERLAYALLGIMSFFLTFIVAGIWFVRERTQGTLERMMLTPISRFQVAAGYVLGIGVFSCVQAILLLLFTRYALGVAFVTGWSFAWALLLMVMQAVVAVEIGAFVSIFSNTEFQVAQFIPVVVIPQVFFSGIIPVETMPYGFDKVAMVMPMYHACTGLKHTLVYGHGLSFVWGYLVVLLAMQVLFLAANTLSLKRYRAL